jgi:hypothetical protein
MAFFGFLQHTADALHWHRGIPRGLMPHPTALGLKQLTYSLCPRTHPVTSASAASGHMLWIT